MTAIRFDRCAFDPHTLRLTRAGQTVPLRPKAALLLRELIDRAGEVVSKAELLEKVWGCHLVADQNLFQAISELRLALPLKNAIVTYPNRGYAFVVPLSEAPPSARWQRWVAAASLAVSVVLGGSHPHVAGDRASALSLPPSIHAFNLGLAQLETDPGQAVHFFQRTLSENPQFLEARMMLAEALLRDGASDAARVEAELTYVQAVESGQAYVQVGVMQLLSRLDAVAGRPQSAIDWARSAAEKALEGGFACAAEEARRQLSQLLAREPDLPRSASPAALPARRDGRLAQLAPPPQCEPLLGDALGRDGPTPTLKSGLRGAV
ncbi:MAG: winged helix-turn-helix domain-containing protein [Pseudomonadota bacterium]